MCVYSNKKCFKILGAIISVNIFIVKMASLMESFEQQYASLTADITGKTGKIPNLTGVEKKKMVSQVEKHMEEAQELVEQMELEIRTLTAAEQLKYRNHVKNYLTELKQMHKELQRAKIAFCDEVLTREELFESEDTSIAEDKQRLLDNTERLERSSRKLQAGYGLALETEQIGADVLNSLYSQRETIKKSRDRLRETDDDLGKSSRILSGMIRRILQNKLILYVVAAVIILVIILAIYFIARRHS